MLSIRSASLALALGVALLPIAAAAQSGVIRGAYVGCLTEQSLDEFIMAATVR